MQDTLITSNVAAVCSSNAVCGDGSCTASESCSSCPSDCGACPSNYYPTKAVSASWVKWLSWFNLFVPFWSARDIWVQHRISKCNTTQHDQELLTILANVNIECIWPDYCLLLKIGFLSATLRYTSSFCSYLYSGDVIAWYLTTIRGNLLLPRFAIYAR